MSKKTLVAALARRPVQAAQVTGIEQVMTQFGGDATQSLVDIRVARLERDLSAQVDGHRAKIEDLNKQIAEQDKLKDVAIKLAADQQVRSKADAVAVAITGSGLFTTAKVALMIRPHGTKPLVVVVGVSIEMGGGCYNRLGSEAEMAYPADAIQAQKNGDDLRKAKAEEESKLNLARRQISKIPQFERQIRGFIGERRIGSTDEGKKLLAELETLQLA